MKLRNSWNKQYETIVDKETGKKKCILVKNGMKDDYRKKRRIESLLVKTPVEKAELDPVTGRTLYGKKKETNKIKTP